MSGLGLCVALSVVLFSLFIAYVVKDVRETLGHGKHIDFKDGDCSLLKASTSIEDFTAVGDGHCVFGGGGDLERAFLHGSASAEAGGIYLVNMTQGTMRKLRIHGTASVGLPKLIVHGVFYSQSSQKLYAVNHDVQQHGESVEIFQVMDTQSFDLKHLASIRSELFLPFGLNDVVEGIDDSELYVTQWLPFGYPAAGKKDPSRNLKEKMLGLLMMPINIFRIRVTNVYRCTVGDSPQCEVATLRKFVMANGIAISNDRQTVYVSDPTGRAIVTLSRQASGALEYVSEFQPIHLVDNIEVGPDGRLYGGTIPIAFTSGTSCDEGLGSEAMIGGRRVACGRSPGGLLEVDISGPAVVQADLVMHDGAKLSGVSAAVKVGERVVLGSPSAPGALVCKL